ncbi:MAG: flagellar filament capping protein FliD [Verrucomicrobiota bacterium]
MASSSGVDLSLSGLASGLDWQTVISKLAAAERSPETAWQTNQAKLSNKSSAFGTIKSNLTTLQTQIDTLKDSSLYQGRTASSSDTTLATVTAGAGALLGTFAFQVTQLATAAKINGTANLTGPLSATNDVSGVTIGTANFASPVTAGTFTVNGKQITIASTDSLQQVFNNIATATSNQVTAAYDSTTDRITLTSTSGSVVLGSANDTSNFLQVAQLYNNGTATVSSAGALGHVQLSSTLSSANLKTAITDGGSGQGAFTVNGVSISYNASTDTVSDVIGRINGSSAGVNATYDALNNRFVLTNKVTGDLGISVADVTGNFLQATGLAGTALTRGQNLLYSVNGGAQLTSTSNNITSSSSGITGLSITALKAGSFTITTSADTSNVKSTIQSFISAYNTVQNYISSQMAVSTDSSGAVTAGLLTADADANGVATNLRSMVYGQLSGLTGVVKQLADLGIQTNGKDNTIALSDSSKLDGLLSNNLTDVQAFFTDATNGLAAKIDTYITNTAGDSGTLTNHQSTLQKQISSIDTQIANLEKSVKADIATWTKEFQAMETVQAQINQQLAYLSKVNWGSSSG